MKHLNCLLSLNNLCKMTKLYKSFPLWFLRPGSHICTQGIITFQKIFSYIVPYQACNLPYFTMEMIKTLCKITLLYNGYLKKQQWESQIKHTLLIHLSNDAAFRCIGTHQKFNGTQQNFLGLNIFKNGESQDSTSQIPSENPDVWLSTWILFTYL